VSFVASILMTIGAAHSMADPYPMQEAYSLFEKSCDASSQLDGVEGRLSSLGWINKIPDTDSAMGRYTAFITASAPSVLGAEGATISAPLTFEKSLNHRNLHLMLLPTKIEGGFIVGCRMIDFSAPEPTDIRNVTDLRSENAIRKIHDGGLMIVEWSGDEELGEGDTQVLYINDDHAVAKQTGAAGLSFKKTHFGVDNQ